MSGMVERAARAFDPELWKRIDCDIGEKTSFAAAARLARDAALRRAGAAIKSMRSPPVENINACKMEPTRERIAYWNAMIAAALELNKIPRNS